MNQDLSSEVHLSGAACGNQSDGQNKLCDLAVLHVLAVLPLDHFHLIFEPQFKLFQPDFFQLFVVGEVTLMGERGETLFVLRMLLGQLAEFIVASQEKISRGKHPADLLKSDCEVKLAQETYLFNDEFSTEINMGMIAQKAVLRTGTGAVTALTHKSARLQ